MISYRSLALSSVRSKAVSINQLINYLSTEGEVKMASTKINFTDSVSINELRTLIPLIGSELTPIIQSEPGCGKTSLLKMIEEDYGDKYDYIYVDCPVKDMSDIGMVIPNHDTRTLEYYVSSLFNLQDPRPKVILLDEFMKAPKLLQVIFTRLCLERMVGDVPLPKGSIVFGTSNNASDGVGDSMLAHAGNRVCILRMAKPSVNDWLQWASENGISKVIRAGVSLYTRCLASYMDGGQEDNPYIFKPNMSSLSFVSPRSLAKADVIIKNQHRLTENSLQCALSGTVGASFAKDLSAFILLERVLVDTKDVIKKPDTIEVPKEISAQIMMMFQAVDVLDNQDDLSKFMVFVNRIPSEEIQSIFFTMMMRGKTSVRIARNNEQIRIWASKNHDLF